MRAGLYNRTVVFQRRETTQDPDDGTTVEGAWTDVATVFANVRDVLPSRAENIEDGINIANRPCRIRVYFRDDLDSSLRVQLKGRSPGEADRLLKIIAGPAEVEKSGFRREIEFTAEQLSTEGQEP